MKFLLFVIFFSIPNTVLASTYITAGKPDDKFYFHVSIKCSQWFYDEHPIKFWFYDHDTLPTTHDKVSNIFQEYLMGRKPLDRIYVGREEGDGPHDGEYELGMVVEHNCNMEGRRVSTDFRFSSENACKTNTKNNCYIYLQIDLSYTKEGEYNWRSVSIDQK